ncbi:MAG: radical SAM protein [Planctomycetota bacterium]|jgi:DNA repair photolyase
MAGRPDPPQPPVLRGRGAAENPANRFQALHLEPDLEATHDDDAPDTVYLRDSTKSVLVRNDSPDVGFTWGVNPYRGCEHGCIYCYARPYHEYLGFSAGLDFETKILVKEDAPARLAKELASPRWEPQPVAMSGVTDPYQPIERRLRLTRRCLEVFAAFRNPVGLVTKNRLVTRDADLLAALAAHRAATVTVTITTLDPALTAKLEPRTTRPEGRLDAIRALSHAGVPAGVFVAPVIPGLTDHELPAILTAAVEAGASYANYIVLASSERGSSGTCPSARRRC